jgi:hypothetical protein
MGASCFYLFAAYYHSRANSRYAAFRVLYRSLGYDDSHLTDEWLDWFIGFYEGDGSIGTTGGRNFFILTQKEETVIRQIFQALGFGKLFFDTKANAWRWTVNTVAGSALLILLFNGNLCSKHRIVQ